MNTSLYFKSTVLTFGALLITICMLMLYIFKGKTTKISYRYISTLVILLILIGMEFLCPYLIHNLNNHKGLYTFLTRFYVAVLNIYKLQIFVIVNIACSRNGKEFNGSKIAKYATYILGYGIIILLDATLPITYQSGGNMPYVVRGFAVLLSNLFAGAISLFEVVLLIRSKKSNNIAALKPLFFCLGLYFIITIIQIKYNYYINVASIFDASLLVIAYLTFENQDYVKLTKLQASKHDVELMSMKKDKELNDIYFNIRSEVSTILDYNNIIEDDSNVSNETIDETIKGISKSSKNLEAITNTIKEGEENVI